MANVIHILHLSGLPVWSLEGKGSMTSLRETSLGHACAGYELTVILPKYVIFGVRMDPVQVPDDAEYDVIIKVLKGGSPR